MRVSALERFWAKVEVAPTGCWLWQANTAPNGYARFWWDGQKGLAHVYAYQTFIGPIPEGFEVDHVCRNRPCVNPGHLEAVTRSTNVQRGLSGQLRFIVQTACKRGHPFDEANTRWDAQGHRTCRACHRESSGRFIAAHPARYAAYMRKYRAEKEVVV